MNKTILFRRYPILDKILSLSKSQRKRVYLVGGVLRDLIKGTAISKDLDFAVDKGAIKFARCLARRIEANFVILDKVHGSARVIYKKKKSLNLDFTDLRGEDIREDLLYRDFSINALALEINSLKEKRSFSSLILDPWGGLKDLKNRRIRILKKDTLKEDPLRIMRAFSLVSILGFHIDKSTKFLLKKYAPYLRYVAGERIRLELLKILGCTSSYKIFKLMDELNILERLFPQIKKMRGVMQGPYHHLDIWGHSLETLKRLELFLKRHKKDELLRAYLSQDISSDSKRSQIIKLGALLHDIGKPQSLRVKDNKIYFHGHERIGADYLEGIAEFLHFTNKEKNILKIIILHHLRAGYLADNFPPTRRAIFRFFRDTKQEAVSVLLVSLADQRATKGPLSEQKARNIHERFCLRLIREYLKKSREKPLPRLITGDDLIKKFKLTPSPLFGKILREIEELQAEGKLRKKVDAYNYVKEFLKKNYSPSCS